MKASSGSSRSATTTDRVQTPADGGLSLDDGETAPAASAKTLQCKEALLSSSDTDDGDAPYSKLVIDLDASGAAPDPPPADSKLPTASASSSTVPEAAPMSALSSTSSRSDGAKSRAQNSTVDGTKTASASHRSSKPHSAELSNGAQKGLKMKIRCSQSGGGGQRHEVSHFHPVVGSPPPPPASGQATVAGHSLKAGGLEKGRSSGSHRRDRQLTKDRAKDHAKDRTPSDKHHAGAAGDVAAGPAAVVVVSRDVSLDASKSLNADGMDRDRDPSSAVLPPLTHDPYEFNASSEDSISCPTKKMKFEQSVQCDAVNSPVPPPTTLPCSSTAISSDGPSHSGPSPAVDTKDASVDACHVGIVTDPDCLGPCEPGTTVTLEGIVWNETENGLLVVNVTWRGKTYVGTLMDATRHHWAPPRFASDSPTSDIDGRTPKGRGKRGRTCVNASRSDMNSSDRKLRSNRCTTGKATTGQSSGGSGSPVRSESGGTLPPKRPRGVDAAPASASNSDGSRANSKSSRSDSRTSNAEFDTAIGDSLIECPAPNCSKKYRHANGLRYHQSRAHPDMVVMNDEDENNEDADGSAKSTDSEQQRPSAKFSRPKMTADDADSVSDGDVWQARSNEMPLSAAIVDGGIQQPLSDPTKSEKKNRNKTRTMSTALCSELQDTPSSPSSHKLVPAKSSADDTPSREKQKHRKKDRDRVREVPSAVADNGSDSNIKLCITSVGIASDRLEGNAHESLDMSMIKQPTSELDSTLHSDTLPVLGGVIGPEAASDSNFLASMTGSSAFVSTVRPKSEIPDSSLTSVSAEQLGGSLLPGKKMKGTPVKHPPDQNNPNSPAYSDISDANDAAPMLEKEATPSAPLDDDEILPSGNIVGEKRPLSRHIQDGFNGSFSGPSSTLYGQPPCLTPAVVASASTAESVKQPNIARMDTSNTGGVPSDDRHTNRTNPPLSRQQLGTESGSQSIAEGSAESADRSLQRSTPRFSATGEPCSSPLPPSVFPAQMLMAYQYVNPNLDAAMLMQLPDYRAHYERLIQQEVTRRHDSPGSHSATHTSSPDIKASPASRPGDADRRGLPPGKGDPALAQCSLPTPPTLIPDRFDDSESRRKMKGSERREEAPRVYPHQHQGASGGARIRRQEDTSSAVSKEGPGGKPSAVVAPQARDRNASSKLRPDDRPRPPVGPPAPSPHDRNKPAIPKAIPTSHQDVPRTPKDVADRCGRDEKGGPGPNRSSQPFKTKEELAGTPSSVPNVPPSLAMSYAPYYPYLAGAPQYAAAGLPYDPSTIYAGINPSIIGYAGTSGPPPGAFLHPAQMGYLPGASAPPGDVPKIISSAGAPMVSPSDTKSREGPGRNFFAGDGPPSGPPVHKIHELKEVAKGTGGTGTLDVLPPVSGAPATGSRELPRPDSRDSGGMKDHERGSPPMQRHLHTHHHMHMLGPPLFGGVFPGADPSLSQAAAATACPPLPRPFLGK